MQGYSKGSVGPFLLVHYNGQLQASMLFYNKASMWQFIAVHYNG
jgi:hypothetical protein